MPARKAQLVAQLTIRAVEGSDIITRTMQATCRARTPEQLKELWDTVSTFNSLTGFLMQLDLLERVMPATPRNMTLQGKK